MEPAHSCWAYVQAGSLEHCTVTAGEILLIQKGSEPLWHWQQSTISICKTKSCFDTQIWCGVFNVFDVHLYMESRKQKLDGIDGKAIIKASAEIDFSVDWLILMGLLIP